MIVLSVKSESLFLFHQFYNALKSSAYKLNAIKLHLPS